MFAHCSSSNISSLCELFLIGNFAANSRFSIKKAASILRKIWSCSGLDAIQFLLLKSNPARRMLHNHGWGVYKLSFRFERDFAFPASRS